jgi:acetyl-CoA carboxylase carboxyl transferase subunit alpha
VADLKVKELIERRHNRLDGYGRFTDTKADSKADGKR